MNLFFFFLTRGGGAASLSLLVEEAGFLTKYMPGRFQGILSELIKRLCLVNVSVAAQVEGGGWNNAGERKRTRYKQQAIKKVSTKKLFRQIMYVTPKKMAIEGV